MRRALMAALAAVLLAGCEVYEPADPEEVARARYVSDEPPSVTLISMVNNGTGRSAHSALLINGSERVLYDPAGTFQHPDLPRRGDIHYGITPRFLDYYERYHARFSHFVHTQTVEVDRATRPVEPFTHVRWSLSPDSVRQDFAGIPGVVDDYVYEVDVGKNRVWEGGIAP
jgi:hypothetical protein